MAKEKEKEKEAPDLDKIVADLHPDKVTEKVSKVHYKARASYDLKKTEVSDFDEFKKELVKYIQHHHKTVFGTELPANMAYAKALEMLSDRNPDPRTQFKDLRSAYDAARDGRLREVLDDISSGLRAEQESAYVVDVIHRIDPFDFETHKKVAAKYIEMAKQVSPDTEFAPPEHIAHDYQRLLSTQRELMRAATQPAKKYKPEKKAA